MISAKYLKEFFQFYRLDLLVGLRPVPVTSNCLTSMKNFTGGARPLVEGTVMNRSIRTAPRHSVRATTWFQLNRFLRVRRTSAGNRCAPVKAGLKNLFGSNCSWITQRRWTPFPFPSETCAPVVWRWWNCLAKDGVSAVCSVNNVVCGLLY